MEVGRLLQFVFPHVAVATRFSSSSTACGVFDSNECATRKKPFVWAQVFGVAVALASSSSPSSSSSWCCCCSCDSLSWHCACYLVLAVASFAINERFFFAFLCGTLMCVYVCVCLTDFIEIHLRCSLERQFVARPQLLLFLRPIH